MAPPRSFLDKIESYLRPHHALLILICLLILFRLPNFSEPYWYGDEGIYLTIGNALRAGERLYAEIIDHKTPLIYYLAMTPSQNLFRLLLLGWMIMATAAFYGLARKLLTPVLTTLSTFIFIVLTSFPWLEGNIPNGELFVMGFVLLATLIISRTEFFKSYYSDQWKVSSKSVVEIKRYIIAGLILGLGVLTKVPALFDALAVLSLGWFGLTRHLDFTNKKHLRLAFQTSAPLILATSLGVVLPILISILYFAARGSGSAYLDYGLLYNFRYAGSWTLPFTNPVLIWSFSLAGKALIAGGLIVFFTLARKWFTPIFQFLATWSVLAIFASLLSNRPYPHYFLQLLPPLILLGAHTIQQCRSKQLESYSTVTKPLQTIVAIVLILGSFSIMKLLQVGFYPTVSYYQRWGQLITGQISPDEYRESFSSLMRDNYKAAEIIKASATTYLGMWGTNPTLYALSGTVPTGRFTVAFHIKDFQAYDETLASIKARHPTFFILMKEDKNTFPELTSYLIGNYYIPNNTFEHFTFWMRM